MSKSKDPLDEIFVKEHIKLKLHEARILLNSSHHIHISDFQKNLLGKKKVNWNIPLNLMKLSRKRKKTYLGLGKWVETERYYLCLVYKGQAFYFDLKALNRLLRQIEVKQ